MKYFIIKLWCPTHGNKVGAQHGTSKTKVTFDPNTLKTYLLVLDILIRFQYSHLKVKSKNILI